jgi:hypothetical protein
MDGSVVDLSEKEPKATTMRNPVVRAARSVLIGLLPLSLTQPVAGQPSKTAERSLKPPWEVWREVRRTSNRGFLAPLIRLHSHADEYLGSSKWRGDFCQAFGTELSFTGRDREAIAYFDKVFTHGEDRPADFDKVYPGGQVQPADLAGLGPEDAVAAITALASHRRVVMIIEAHHAPQHRLMTLLLLQSLKREGYGYFAAETLDKSDDRLQSRGYPTLATGFYTAEPLYGDVVRTALRLGYRVMPYELKRIPIPCAAIEASPFWQIL